MEIRYLAHQEIDKNKWDRCIAKSFNGIVYAYSWYLDIVCEDWDALVDGDYLRVFPLPYKSRYGIRFIYQPFFTQQLGVISQNILTPEVVENFLEAIPANFRYVEINLNTYNKVDSSKYEVKQQLNHELDLINSYENIHKKYSENLKRNLKKTENSGLFINQNAKPDEIIRLFKVNKGRQLPHLRDDDYITLNRLIYAAIHKGIAKVYGVYTPYNEIYSGAFFLISNRKITFLFSGSNEEGRTSHALAFLLDHVIREHSTKHLTLDFEGSNNEGLARFYQSFGSKRIHYLNVTINKLNIPFRQGLTISRKFKSYLLNKLITK